MMLHVLKSGYGPAGYALFVLAYAGLEVWNSSPFLCLTTFF